MSDAVYPILPGLAWSVSRTPQWSSNQQKAKSGRRYAVGDRMYPTYKWSLPYEFLRQYGSNAEQRTLLGFVNARRGALQDFLYRDPDDYMVTGQVLGIGPGSVACSFPLVRDLGGFVEPVIAADTIQVFINGVAAAYGTAPNQWRVDAIAPNIGAVLFDGGVGAGLTITWTGTYYWRCSFISDTIPFEQFAKGFWKTGNIEFESHAP